MFFFLHTYACVCARIYVFSKLNIVFYFASLSSLVFIILSLQRCIIYLFCLFIYYFIYIYICLLFRSIYSSTLLLDYPMPCYGILSHPTPFVYASICRRQVAKTIDFLYLFDIVRGKYTTVWWAPVGRRPKTHRSTSVLSHIFSNRGLRQAGRPKCHLRGDWHRICWQTAPCVVNRVTRLFGDVRILCTSIQWSMSYLGKYTCLFYSLNWMILDLKKIDHNLW